jgi:photosystem II stability/assembly factor-like uncharacterized protein
MRKITLLLTLTLAITILTGISTPQKKRKEDAGKASPSEELYRNLNFRNIGPFRGGRSAAVTGVSGNDNLFYMGSTGGGVWRTTDRGSSWNNISDGFFGGTIGSLDVADSDNNILFVAGGEKTVRGNVSHGYGIWKSVDAGENWEYKGLAEGQYISRIRIHPTNSDIVYAAVLGHLFGPNSDRGVYKTIDGGDTWSKILYIDDNAGAVDLILDPSNPRVIYASTWRVRRTPYSLESGGQGSALWKSTDSGKTWVNLSEKPGMPGGPLGIIGVTLSKANNKKIYALVEAKDGGLFVSNNGGDSWDKVNGDRNLRQRAWYYTRLYADPIDEDKLYILNVGFHRSLDGGKSFDRIQTPHGDHHDLWIDPLRSDVMIIGDDGGAQVTIDGGGSWSTPMNQPTAQFYRVTTDNFFPYRIYAAQQDNSTVRIASRTFSGGISEDDWESTAGGESGWIAPDPKNGDIVYGGSYGGLLQRLDHSNGESRLVDIWPDNPMGWGADSLEQRFQWNYPILFSKHDNSVLYAASNMLFSTRNEGQTWKQISPDLTRNDKSKMGSSGGVITKDNTSVEYYGTIFSVAESSTKKGVIWCGTDDGLIQITKNSGDTWEDVTPDPSILPEWTMINSIEAHPSIDGGLYVAATAYKSDDFTPYLLKTIDFGQTWKVITKGIDKTHFTRVIRSDKYRDGLLYCGTESGLYISFDDGESWRSFQLNLPIVPITDLEIKGNDLVVATQGRAIWIFDYLDLIRQMDNSSLAKSYTLYKPADTYRISGGRSRADGSIGANPLPGSVISFHISNKPVTEDNFRLDIFDSKNRLIKSFRSNMKGVEDGSDSPYSKLEITQGLNQVSWDLSYPGALPVEGMILWGGNLRGPTAIPGKYLARFVMNGDSTDTWFNLLKSPISTADAKDIEEQFDFLMVTRDKLTQLHKVIIDIRKLKIDLASIEEKLDKVANREIQLRINNIVREITSIEEALYQTKNRSSQDPLNFPIKLGNKLASLRGTVSSGDFRPTDQAYIVKDELIGKIDSQLFKFYNIREIEIPKLNSDLRSAGIDYLKD